MRATQPVTVIRSATTGGAGCSTPGVGFPCSVPTGSWPALGTAPWVTTVNTTTTIALLRFPIFLLHNERVDTDRPVSVFYQGLALA